MIIRTIILLFVCLLLTPTGFAHPHVFISPQAVFHTDGSTLTHLTVDWVFDDMTSLAILGGAEDNRQIPLSEFAALWGQGLPAPDNLPFFVFLEVDGVVYNRLPVSDAALQVTNQMLHYTFTVTAGCNVSSEAKLWFEDTSNYIAFPLNSGGFSVSGPGSVSKRADNYVNKIVLSL